MASGAGGKASSTRVKKVGNDVAASACSTSASEREAPGQDAGVPWWALGLLLAVVRLGGTWYYQVVTDCDQTFNYEEPTHYLLYGSGLQTWEYAPQYALRSYAYVGLHAVIGLLVGAAWGADKIAVFHRIHCVLALACAAGELYFVTGIARAFGRRLALVTFVCLLCSAGMLHAAPSYLPSTFTMVGLLFAWGAWLRGRVHSTVAATVAALCLGWPFAVVAVLPMGLHLLWRPALLRLLPAAVLSLAALCGVCVAVDFLYYHRTLLAPWNIILYNAFGVGGGGQGSDLYGVEPTGYYAANLALNFNVQFAAAAASPLLVVLEAVLAWRRHRAAGAAKRAADADVAAAPPSGDGAPSAALVAVFEATPRSAEGALFRRTQLAALLGQLWLWFGLMTARPHKEERFMFVAFPLISAAAAFSVCVVADLLETLLCRPRAAQRASGQQAPAVPQRRSRIFCGRFFTLVFLVVSAQLSGSRIVALSRGYSAPFAAWTFLARELQAPLPAAAAGGTESDLTPAGGPADARGASTGPTHGAASQHGFFAQRGTESASEALFLHTQPPLASLADVAAPLQPFLATGAHAAAPADAPAGAVVCVGKEWYRFPSSFFLPDRTRDGAASPLNAAAARASHGPARVAFIKSAFGGQLPQPFLPKPNGTAALRGGFNDLNAEETDRYVPLSACDYVVDSLLPTPRQGQDTRYEPYWDALVSRQGLRLAVEPRAKGGHTAVVAQKEPRCNCMRLPATPAAGGNEQGTEERVVQWRSLWSAPFVHADSSPTLTRAFFIPRVSEQRNAFAFYHILRQESCSCADKPNPGDGGGSAAPGARN